MSASTVCSSGPAEGACPGYVALCSKAYADHEFVFVASLPVGALHFADGYAFVGGEEQYVQSHLHLRGIAGIESAEHGVDTEGQLELSRQDTWRIVAIYVGVIE